MNAHFLHQEMTVVAKASRGKSIDQQGVKLENEPVARAAVK